MNPFRWLLERLADRVVRRSFHTPTATPTGKDSSMRPLTLLRSLAALAALQAAPAAAETRCVRGDIAIVNDTLVKGEVVEGKIENGALVCPPGTSAVALGKGGASVQGKDGASIRTTGVGSPIITGSGSKVSITIDGNSRTIRN